jgi:hypothetical protein
MKRLVVVLLVLSVVVAAANAGDRIKFPEFALATGVVGFSVADTAITIYGTSRLGMTEMNGLMRPLLENHRYAALWAVQGVAVAGILWACHGLIHSGSKASRIIGYALLVAANAGRAYCVIHNINLHNKVRRGI